MNRLYTIIITLLCLLSMPSTAQQFFNLTADEVSIDSMLPMFSRQQALPVNYADSVYEVSIEYPEFIDMSKGDIARLRSITSERMPEMPVIDSHISLDRKRAFLEYSFCPIVERGGKLQKLVGFKISISSKAVVGARRVATETSNRYAAHSVLSSGRWVRIGVTESGFHHLSDDLIREAGFSNPSKVKVYGYGGAIQPDALTGDYLTKTDDLKEVPTCTVNGRRLFYAVGPVNWSSATDMVRTRNPYSTYGCYFLTENDDEPLTLDEQTFASNYYPLPNDYHSLYEPEGFAWYHSGRNLYSGTLLSYSKPQSFTLQSSTASARLTVVMSYNSDGTAVVDVNDTTVGNIVCRKSEIGNSRRGAAKTASFDVSGLNIGDNTVSLKLQSNTQSSLRLDYAVITCSSPRAMPSLADAELPVPDYLETIANQDLHSDTAADMIIIVPKARQTLEQAQALQTLHQERDNMKVRIVSADQLYNEFSSGTPDVSAYRRYLKMLYDRAQNESEQPRYLLLFGDGAWDNRMLSPEWKGYSPDNFLLCYESEESFSEINSYVAEDYFGLLDDGEIITNFRGKPDVAIGRLTARTASEAQVMVDKIIGYAKNESAGAWQNTVCVIADDGNANQHMIDAESIASVVADKDSSFFVNKVYLDAYNRESSATGYSYPDVRRILLQQMKDGALVMNYSGHGSAYQMTHEKTMLIEDFKTNNCGGRLPLWLTASCDIAPFDSQEENIGEEAMYNKRGGAVAFVGTTRTVYMTQNRYINRAYMSHVFDYDDNGRRISIGEALRLAKNDLVTTGGNTDLTQNKLHYVLLGDPALVLAVPTLKVVVDSINGQAIATSNPQMSAGKQATISGHIEGHSDYRGVVTAKIFDVEQTILCRLNAPEGNEGRFQFNNRTGLIYAGSDSVYAGRFTMTFAVPKDITYSDKEGQIIVYAIDNNRSRMAHGQQKGFTLGGGEGLASDGMGPSIYCYLNKTSFSNGDAVNVTPYFHADITDKDGINAAGSGIGHDMELIIDGEMNLTFHLNDYFQYAFGDYCTGSVGYTLPELSEGSHKLLFRAWDMLNNSSTAELSFYVDPSLEPELSRIVCTRNPAKTSTQFVISHDRTGSEMDVVLEVFDSSGRMIWQRTENGLSTDDTYTVEWDLCGSGGSKLRGGLYIYRIWVGSNGSEQTSASGKLIILDK